MKWYQYRIHTTTDAVDQIGELLYEMGIAGFEVTDHVPLTAEEEKQMYTDIPANLGPDDGTATITFYTEGDNAEEDKTYYSTGSSLRDQQMQEDTPDTPSFDSPEDLIHALCERIRQLQQYLHFPDVTIEYSLQDDSQWKDTWKDSFQSFRVADDLIIKPVWEDTPDFATPQDTIIEIEPGSAFGTGTHETTKLCLLSLRKYLHAGTSLMDAGCGSGILAISALLSGAGTAFCLDIDPYAVSGTLENAALNHLDETRLTAIHGNILEDAASIHASHPEPFDVVVANILADVIIPLADVVPSFLKADGLFISSGILAEKADAVEDALLRNHFTILEKNTLGEWVSFVARI